VKVGCKTVFKDDGHLQRYEPGEHQVHRARDGRRFGERERQFEREVEAFAIELEGRQGAA